MIKLIVSDMDGTMLLPKRQQLEPEVLDLIERLLDAGYLFVAASGRQYANLYRMFQKVADRVSYICENGSLVIHKQKVIHKSVIPEEIKQQLVDEILQHDTAELLYSAVRGSYIQPKSDYYYDLVVNRMKNDVFVTDHLRETGEECIKLSIYERDQVSGEEERYWVEKYGEILKVVRSSEKWLDFMPKGTNKGMALKLILERESLSREECMGFGDNDNDVELMKLVGYSYGMKNGTETLKQAVNCCVGHPSEILEQLVRILHS